MGEIDDFALSMTTSQLTAAYVVEFCRSTF